MKNRKFWKWTNLAPETGQADTEAERVLELYGTIAEESWFEDNISPQVFRDELFAGNGPVTIWLNSPGGDCIAASQIYSMLMDYKGDVTIKIDGIAASAASVIAMAGTKVLMAPTSLLMIHNPMTVAFGDYTDMQKAMEMLDETKESIINAYEIRTGMSRAKLSHLMDSETWMNANKAIELGFADDILEDEKRRKCGTEAFYFSGKAAEISLLNKLMKPVKAEKAVEEKPNPVVDAKPTPVVEASKPSVVEEPNVETAVTENSDVTDNQHDEVNVADTTASVSVPESSGTSISDLFKRLSLLK